MIWYLLYPFRGTTEPPDLPPSHPLRSGFVRYGRYVAGHVITALLTSATVAIVLIYPIPYLFTSDFINGASYVPHHVWTLAQPLTYNAAVEPDIIMRSIWVHSNYMEALSADLLTSALELQDELLGETRNFHPQEGKNRPETKRNDGWLSLAQRDTLHIANGLTNESWFFHSPLIYWQCSRDSILSDPDILSTINDRKNLTNRAGTILRHSVVFSGKRFEDRRLLAADALVITLLYRPDSPIGREWAEKALLIPQKVTDQFDVYPPDGRAETSQLYEFQFRPISAQDILTLALAYSLALCYFLMSLSKLRAVKSKIGLIVTIATQIAFSIMSSFTVCAIFNFDLSRIPQAAYPLVVLSMSLENIFRLINAVILTPSEDSMSNRIGYAFGQTAHTSLTSSMQNVLILVGLSRVVSPGVSAFCVFAAVAIVFDFFYLSTFFLSVLSVDVRRMELGDALAKAAARQSRRKNQVNGRATWTDGFFQGKITWSTRIAGTIVMIGFVIIAQGHFFGDDNMFRNLLRMYTGMEKAQGPTSTESSFLKELHQARSHPSWLRNQDHENAQEIIRLIKPTAYSYVAKVFEPLVFVRKNSDRMPHSKEPTLLPAVYDFVHHQLARCIVMVVLVVAALRLLINYLLWGDDVELGNHEDHAMLSVISMGGGHILDVAMLARSKAGHIVSVGLDRIVRVWDIRGPGSSYIVANGNDADKCPFPILAMAIDETSDWLALVSFTRVSLWNLNNRQWGGSISLEDAIQRPAALFFVNNAGREQPSVVMVDHSGTVTELAVETEGVTKVTRICPEPLVMARHLTKRCDSYVVLYIIMISKRGRVYISRLRESEWENQPLAFELEDSNSDSQVVHLSPIGAFILATRNSALLIDAEHGELLHTFHTEIMSPKSLQCTFSMHHASKSELLEVSLLTLCYSEVESGDCIVQSYVPSDDFEAIYFRNSSSNVDGDESGHKRFAAKELKKRLKSPGSWYLLWDGSVIGIRRVAQNDNTYTSAGSNPYLRRRHGAEKRQQYSFANWEVWAVSPCDKPDMEECRPLFENGNGSKHLVVSELGPKTLVGLRSVAFAFGNVIKLVTAGGHERYDGHSDTGNYDSLMNTASRRRKLGTGKRSRLPS